MKTISSSLTPGIISNLLSKVGLLVMKTSNVLLNLVASNTICCNEWSCNSSMNSSLIALGYWFPTVVFMFQSMSGRFGSPPIMIIVLLFFFIIDPTDWHKPCIHDRSALGGRYHDPIRTGFFFLWVSLTPTSSPVVLMDVFCESSSFFTAISTPPWPLCLSFLHTSYCSGLKNSLLFMLLLSQVSIPTTTSGFDESNKLATVCFVDNALEVYNKSAWLYFLRNGLVLYWDSGTSLQSDNTSLG